MTVAELIEALSRFPASKPVMWRDYTLNDNELPWTLVDLTEDDISEASHSIASRGEPYVLIGN